jgi:hypothetical protein
MTDMPRKRRARQWPILFHPLCCGRITRKIIVNSGEPPGNAALFGKRIDDERARLATRRRAGALGFI